QLMHTTGPECIGVELEIPFPRMAWTEADARFGSDRPDTRFGLDLHDATAITRGSQFGVFAKAEAVRYVVVDRELSRAELDRLEEFAKEWGARGLAYIVRDAQGEVRSPIAKFLSEEEVAGLDAAPGSAL